MVLGGDLVPAGTTLVTPGLVYQRVRCVRYTMAYRLDSKRMATL